MNDAKDDVYFSTNRLMLSTRIAHFSDIGLTDGGMRMLVNPNAGGSSKYSEILSYEILRSMYAARLVWSEMELKYFPSGGKITDYSAEVFGHYVGVSVARAMKFRGTFVDADALRLLHKKLYGINCSSATVVGSFHKQILHLLAEHEYIAEVLQNVYPQLDSHLRSNTIVIVTVVKDAPWVYYNR